MKKLISTTILVLCLFSVKAQTNINFGAGIVNSFHLLIVDIQPDSGEYVVSDTTYSVINNVCYREISYLYHENKHQKKCFIKCKYLDKSNGLGYWEFYQVRVDDYSNPWNLDYKSFMGSAGITLTPYTINASPYIKLDTIQKSTKPKKAIKVHP